MAHHPIVHIELSAGDLAASKAFYGTVFGWEMQDWPEMNYVTWTSGEGAPGGGFNLVSNGMPPGSTIVYVNTDDLAASVAAIKAHGGALVGEQLDIPGVGLMQMFTDPAGNVLSLLQPPADMGAGGAG